MMTLLTPEVQSPVAILKKPDIPHLNDFLISYLSKTKAV